MRGLIPRSIEEIGAHKVQKEKEGWTFSMDVSFLEIYNDELRDLLRVNQKEKLKHEIKVGSDGRRTVTNLTIIPTDPNDKEAVDTILALAAKRRSTAVTSMNATSSRSHSVFTLHMTSKHEGDNKVVRGTLQLVDLAGTERLDRSGAIGHRAKEATAINKSLSSLVGVLTAIQNKQDHIPFRNSPLTYLLEPALKEGGKVCILVNISLAEANLKESVCSLRFARNAKKVELGKPKRMIEVVKQSKHGNSSMRVTTAKAPPDLNNDPSSNQGTRPEGNNRREIVHDSTSEEEEDDDDEEDDDKSHDDNSEKESTDDDEDDHDDLLLKEAVERHCEQKKKDKRQAKKQLDEAQKEAEAKDKRIESLETKEKEMEEEIKTLKQDKTSLTGQIQAKDDKIEELVALNKTKNKVIKSLKKEKDEEIEVKDEEIEELKKQLEDAQAVMSTLEGEVEQRDTTIRDMEIEVADRDTTIETLEDNVRTLDNNVEILTEEVGDLRAEVEQNDEAIEIAQNALKRRR